MKKYFYILLDNGNSITSDGNPDYVHSQQQIASYLDPDRNFIF
jgi:hypothetical protein